MTSLAPEITADRLDLIDNLACAFMDTRPDLTPMSLDEWLIEYNDQLSPQERAIGHDISALYFEEQHQ